MQNQEQIQSETCFSSVSEWINNGTAVRRTCECGKFVAVTPRDPRWSSQNPEERAAARREQLYIDEARDALSAWLKHTHESRKVAA